MLYGLLTVLRALYDPGCARVFHFGRCDPCAGGVAAEPLARVQHARPVCCGASQQLISPQVKSRGEQESEEPTLCVVCGVRVRCACAVCGVYAVCCVILHANTDATLPLPLLLLCDTAC